MDFQPEAWEPVDRWEPSTPIIYPDSDDFWEPVPTWEREPEILLKREFD